MEAAASRPQVGDSCALLIDTLQLTTTLGGDMCESCKDSAACSLQGENLRQLHGSVRHASTAGHPWRTKRVAVVAILQDDVGDGDGWW